MRPDERAIGTNVTRRDAVVDDRHRRLRADDRRSLAEDARGGGPEKLQELAA